VSPVGKTKIRLDKGHLHGGVRKMKHPTFIGEHKKGEEVAYWMLEMRKYL